MCYTHLRYLLTYFAVTYILICYDLFKKEQATDIGYSKQLADTQICTYVGRSLCRS